MKRTGKFRTGCFFATTQFAQAKSVHIMVRLATHAQVGVDPVCVRDWESPCPDGQMPSSILPALRSAYALGARRHILSQAGYSDAASVLAWRPLRMLVRAAWIFQLRLGNLRTLFGS